MKITEVPISKILPAKYNPRIITPEELSGLVKSIMTFGIVDPFILNKDFTLIGGHQRLQGVEKAAGIEPIDGVPNLVFGITDVPCVILDLDKKQEKKLNIILNNPHIQGKFDEKKLNIILEELSLDNDFAELRLDELETLDIDEANEEVDEDDTKNKLDTYLQGTIKQIIFYFDNDTYEVVYEKIAALHEKLGTKDNSNLLIALINFYEDNQGKKEE